MRTGNLSGALLLSAMGTLSGCAARQMIQPAARGQPPSQLATVTTVGVSRKNNLTVSLQRITDVGGTDAVSFNMLTIDLRNSAVVVPGRYEIQVMCGAGMRTATPSGKFELRGGYTYILDCSRENGFWVGVTAVEVPNGSRSDAGGVLIP